MVELVDSLDLGAVTSVKVFPPCRCHCEVVGNAFMHSEAERINPFPTKAKSRFTCFYIPWIKRNAPPRLPRRVKIRGTTQYAGMMELADMQDLGSCAEMRWGSNPHARTRPIHSEPIF